jgi:hypothetical protein
MSPLLLFVFDFDTLVIPFFIYGDCVYFALDSYSLRKLTMAFNTCVRYVYRRRLFYHISDFSDSILGCSLLTYMEFRLTCFMFSLVTGGRHRHLYDSLVFSRSERTLRINSLRQSTEYMARSVLARGIRFGTRSQSQLGLPHHFRALNGLFVPFWGSCIEGCKWILLFFYFFSLSTPVSFNLSLSPFFHSSLNFISLSYFFFIFLILSLYYLALLFLSNLLSFFILCFL